jgi:hypothetical protein
MKTNKFQLQWTWKEWLVVFLLLLVLIVGLTFVDSKMYAGEIYEYDIGTENFYWNLTENTSNLDGLNISKQGTKAILNFDLLFQPNNFTITFYDSSTNEEIINDNINDGGSSRGHWVYNNPLVDTKENDSLDIGGTNEETPQETEELEEEVKDGSYLGMALVIVFIGIILGFAFWIYSKYKKPIYQKEVSQPKEQLKTNKLKPVEPIEDEEDIQKENTIEKEGRK